jgi:hypothetical protein
MRRTVIVVAILAVLVGGLVVRCWVAPTSAQDPARPQNGPNKQGPAPLPIAQVVLFNSGVGYFQREGQVDGNTRVDLSFPSGDINDLLKSLVLQDQGNGKVGAVSYDSQDPIDKILRSFALDLNNNPTFGQILNQARGEKIELLRQEKKDGPPTKLTGEIVGMEVKQVPAGKDTVVPVDQLNLLGPDGLQGVPLSQVVAVRFINPVLDNEFKRALQVLAGSHDVQKKTVSLAFNGDGKRQVRVGYVVERPIWKTSYRLMLGPNGKLFLQGWALVENPSDDDWNNVRMVLVSGRPISYQMNLYEPLYIPRPTVEPELFASLRPPVYGGNMNPMQVGGIGVGGGPGAAVANADHPQVPGALPAPGGFNALGGVGGFNALGAVGGFNGMANWNQWGGRNQLGPNLGGNFVNPYQNLQQQDRNFAGQNSSNNDFFALNNTAQGQRLSFDELQKRRQEQIRNKEAARKAGGAIAGLNFKEGIASVASAEEIGDYYRYVLDQKITLSRQKSAMLPILNQNIEGTKLSIFNESVHPKYPLLGLRLKNTSSQPLTQGPMTVYEDGSYSGDTRILDLQPAEERLLSYAMDLGTEVKATTKTSSSPRMTFKIGADVLTAHFKLRETRSYLIKNRSQADRTLIIEHPIRTNWTLVDPKQPAERTRDVYRFQIMVPAGQTVKEEVVEEQSRADQFALASPGGDQPPRYAVGLGIEVKPLVKTDPEELIGLRIVKGVLEARYKIRQSKTYFVQNVSDQKREFVVDHVIRPEWKRLGATGEQAGPDVYRFVLEVPAGKTGHQEVVEERTRLDKTRVVKSAPETLLREFLLSPAPGARVKEALTTFLGLQGKLSESRRQLGDSTGQLDALSKDQARLRENLHVIPQSSEPYKDFLQKFVTQEREIEALQRQQRQLQASVLRQANEVEAFVANLNAE